MALCGTMAATPITTIWCVSCSSISAADTWNRFYNWAMRLLTIIRFSFRLCTQGACSLKVIAAISIATSTSENICRLLQSLWPEQLWYKAIWTMPVNQGVSAPWSSPFCWSDGRLHTVNYGSFHSPTLLTGFVGECSFVGEFGVSLESSFSVSESSSSNHRNPLVE